MPFKDACIFGIATAKYFIKMAEKKLYPFVMNDENLVNSYGFRVRNSGIDFSRFDANPVMLDSHINETGYVRGNWKNRRFEGAKLWMDGNFDSELPEAARLEGQVDRGFVKGGSLGLAIDWNDEPFQRQPDDNWDLVKSVAVEGTVCAVPSNSGALCQLFDMTTGKPITEDQLKLSLAKLNADFKNLNNTPNMEKITLTTDANAFLLSLNLTNIDSPAGISNAFMKLKADLEDGKTKYNELKAETDKQIKLQAEAVVDAAIANEQILKGERDEWVTFAVSNLGLATKQIAKIPGKVSLSSQLRLGGNATEIKTVDDFEKLTEEKKLAFKAEHPDEYKLLFAQ